ncbi:hypothetical protein V6N12_030382 [Hibiscus sabdariffa]|uniref:Uncharacterized protein n=1 Tax=Hibiscus sabdariffa TaxID=183260 RepID=A0ABR2C0S4_9ROSI
MQVATEATKIFLLAVESIIQQQAEEHNQQRKSDKLEKRLHKEFISLTEMEKWKYSNFRCQLHGPLSHHKQPLSVKHAKIEALKKGVDMEKAKHLNSDQVSKTMVLNHLKTSLFNVFHALIGYLKACVQVFQAIHSHNRRARQTKFD